MLLHAVHPVLPDTMISGTQMMHMMSGISAGTTWYSMCCMHTYMCPTIQYVLVHMYYVVYTMHHDIPACSLPMICGVIAWLCCICITWTVAVVYMICYPAIQYSIMLCTSTCTHSAHMIWWYHITWVLTMDIMNMTYHAHDDACCVLHYAIQGI